MTRTADVPADVWDMVEALSRRGESSAVMRKVQEFGARCILAERQWAAEIVSDSSGYFVPPPAFREVFYKHVEDVTGHGDVWVFNGKSLDDWDKFFQLLLATYADAIRKGGDMTGGTQ